MANAARRSILFFIVTQTHICPPMCQFGCGLFCWAVSVKAWFIFTSLSACVWGGVCVHVCGCLCVCCGVCVYLCVCVFVVVLCGGVVVCGCVPAFVSMCVNAYMCD